MTSLAVGIGASVGVFTLVDRAIWQPLPIPDAATLVWVESVDRAEAGASSPGAFALWRDGSRTMTAIGAMRQVQGTWRDHAGTDRIAGSQTSRGVFDALRINARLGRLLTTDDEQPGAAAAVVISHRLWRTRFGSDPSAAGRIIQLDSRPRLIVGVLPESADALTFLGEWSAPLPALGSPAVSGPRYLNVVGRVDAHSLREAEIELTTLLQSARATGDSGEPLTAHVQPLSRMFSAVPYRVLMPLFIAVLVVLAIAASNAASLLIAEGERRRPEFSVRAALGASRWRLIQQLSTESLLMTITATALGLVVAQWCIDGLLLVLPAGVAPPTHPQLDDRAAIFAAILAVVVTTMVAALPAWRLGRTPIAELLALDARGLSTGMQRCRRVFVAVQVALATSLAVAGTLMLETTRELSAMPLNYDDRVLTAALRFPASDFSTPQQLRSTIASIAEAAQQLPGVDSAAVATRVPLSGGAPGSAVR
ncbi:MAG TPA: FtsX-like permease family protein, partial [Vicinamibacterales bacterium]